MYRQTLVVRAAAITARDIVGGLLAGVAVGALVDELGRPLPMLLRRGLSIIVATTAMILIGRAWGRDMGRLVGLSDVGSVGRGVAIAFGPAVAIVALALAAAEPAAIERGARSGVGIHVVYTLLFVPAAFLVAGVGAFALGRSIHGAISGMRLATAAGVAAAAAFLAVDLLMDAAGWRVGGPNAARRATMVTVTALGICAAGIAAGAAIGAMLSRSPNRT